MFANNVGSDSHEEGILRDSRAPTHKQDNSQAYPQFQFYVENRLLRHPLVSPVLSYLGGLPPLFFIAGNGEVLRDEIVYTWVIPFWAVCD
jgi:acetyl esterase/lipase